MGRANYCRAQALSCMPAATSVLSAGTSRDVHLPPGEWYDVARGRTVHGDLHAYPADLGTLPLFVRMGTPDTKSLIAALRH